MFNPPAKTVARPVRVDGIGLHSGAPCAVEVRPASSGGLRWSTPNGEVPVHVDHVDAPGGSTRFPGIAETPEHLLAALVGLGVTDAILVAEGGEVPGLDGSASPWVGAIDVVETGISRGLVVEAPVRVELDGGVALAEPADALVLDVSVDFGPAARERVEVELSPAAFGTELAWARTFLPHASLDAVRSAGRGRGLGPGEVVVLGPRGPVVPLRGPAECARHKALDLLGDLALVGCPVQGRITVERGTHALHHALVRALLAG